MEKEKYSHIDDWMRKNDTAHLKYLQERVRKDDSVLMIYEVLAVREYEAELRKENKWSFLK